MAQSYYLQDPRILHLTEGTDVLEVLPSHCLYDLLRVSYLYACQI